MSSPVDPKALVNKLNKSRPLGAEDLWLIEQDLNQQLQAGAVAEPLSPDPLTDPLVNVDSTGGCGAGLAVSGVASMGAGIGAKHAVPDALAWSTDLFFSMVGLTSSVASARSELSLSDVDLGASVHSDMTARRLSAQGHPTGECSRDGKNWEEPWCWCDVISLREAYSDA